jgi:hypothetical protein
MNAPPPPPPSNETDAGSLRLLATLNFVAAAVCLAGIGLLYWHYARMQAAFLDVTSWKHQPGGGVSLEQFLAVFVRYYLAGGAFLAVGALGNLASGLFIRRRRHWLLSVVVASFDCLAVPLGTVLGAFAIVVLLRDSVRRDYAASREPGPGAGPSRGTP